jgi:hypothetical protein
VRSSIIHGEVREVANILSTVLPILGEREYTPLTIEEALCPLGPMDPVEEARVNALLNAIEVEMDARDGELPRSARHKALLAMLGVEPSR